MKNNAIILQCISMLFASTLLLNPTYAQKPLIAVGTWTDDYLDRPLIAVSQDMGLTWSYPHSANIPPLAENFSRGVLQGASCNDTMCVAAGDWMDTDGIFRPLLAFTEDEGNTWNYQDMIQEASLPDIKYSKLYTVACAENFCLAGGIYTNTSEITLPLLAKGTYVDNKVSWDFMIEETQNNIPDDFHWGRFNQVSCNTKLCMAAGSYVTKENFGFPLLMQSDRNGTHWHRPELNFPPDFMEGLFQGVSCYEKICLAVGEYHNSQYRKPLLILSTDEGKTWHTPSIPLPENMHEAILTKASCNKEWCIAAGAAIESDNSWPFLVFSRDHGMHWEYSDYLGNYGLPEDFISGLFTSTACNAQNCIAAGFYFGDVGSHPLIGVSEDKGKTWNYPVSAQKSSVGALLEDGMYTQASCNDLMCFATGDFLQKNHWEEYCPLLATSLDTGKTWYYPDNVTAENNLPLGFKSGQFMSSS